MSNTYKPNKDVLLALKTAAVHGVEANDTDTALDMAAEQLVPFGAEGIKTLVYMLLLEQGEKAKLSNLIDMQTGVFEEALKVLPTEHATTIGTLMLEGTFKLFAPGPDDILRNN